MRIGTSGALEYLHADERGSVMAISNFAGQLQVTHQYDVYGQPVDPNDSLFRYTGQIRIADTDLYHYKARAYHPGLGRFLQTDPIGYEDGMNLYAYVGNDPVNVTDASGLCGNDYCADRIAEGARSFAAAHPDAAKVAGMVGAGVMVTVSAAIVGPAVVAAALSNPAAVSRATITVAEMAAGDAAGPGLALGAAGVAAKSATQVAREGGRHAGQLNQFSKQTSQELRKSIASFDKNIAKHEGWIQNPTSKVTNFNELSPEHQKNLIHHWQQDVARANELKEIAKDVLEGK